MKLQKLLSEPNTFSNISTLETISEDLTRFGSAADLIGNFALGINDISEGHGDVYAVGDIGVSTAGAAVAFFACGGELGDPLAVGCAFLGASGAHEAFKIIASWFK